MTLKSSYFGKLLKEERKKLGLTQAQAAEVLGVAKRTLEYWETDQRKALAITQEGALARLFSYSSDLGVDKV